MAVVRGRLVQRLLVVNHSKFSARVVYLMKYRIVTVFAWVNVNRFPTTRPCRQLEQRKLPGLSGF